MIWLAALLGLVVGSFLNVLIHRLPLMMEREWQAQCAELSGGEKQEPPPLTLAKPRSRCPHCGAGIAAWDNIPLLSYLLLRGRCRACKTPISLRYPLVETLTACLFGFAAWRLGAGLALAGALVFLAALVALAFIDLETHLLPDDLTLPLLWVGLLVNSVGVYVDPVAALWGAAAGYVTLWAVYWLFKLATGKEGMGYGDFKLMAALGAWLGWPLLPLLILISATTGALVGIALLVFTRRDRHTPLPFGPYLALAGGVVFFWGPGLTGIYLGWLR